jgi:anaerobic magnesium-protoporphyrin IX monomethyl ester cyclase
LAQSDKGKMARVCLVYTNIGTDHLDNFHHGIAYLVGALRASGHEVTFRYVLTEGQLHELDGLTGLDIIGFTITTNQARYVRRYLAQKRPNARLIAAGGVHSTLYGADIFDQIPNLDASCIGDGEVSFVDLCGRLDRGEDLHSTPGFIFRTESGIIGNDILPLRKIDDLSLPDYTLFDLKRVIDQHEGWFIMLLSRGCPYSCSFCCNHRLREIYRDKGNYLRIPTVNHALKIIKNNLNAYPKTRGIFFNDDIFTWDRDWAIEFCKAYKAQIGLPFGISTRIENIDEGLLRALADSGCRYIGYGIETGNEWLRRNILKKDLSNGRIKEIVEMTHRAGIRTISYNMVGLPFETYEMAMETFMLNLELRVNNGYAFYFVPFPQTHINKIAGEYGLVFDEKNEKTGFLDMPGIRPVHMTNAQMDSALQSLYVLFRLRHVFSTNRLPLRLEALLLGIALPFKSVFFRYFIKKNDNPIIRGLKAFIGKSILKYSY